MRVPTARIESCGDVSCEFLVNPIPRPRPKPFTVTLKPKRPRVIFVDSGKPNSMGMLRRASEILRAQGVEVDETIDIKDSSGIPMPASHLDRLAQTEALVVSGVND
jgi:hypothetical protein